MASNDNYGIDVFEAMFNKKKTINLLLEKEKRVKKEVKDSYQKAKQRIVQIDQLNDKVERQTSLLQSQIQKINDAHNVSKLLMMEKIVKLQRETAELERKKNKCFEAKIEKERASNFT